MADAFGDALSRSIQRAQLPLRRVAAQADIPHQTLFNWVNGTRPRWHPGLDEELRRLGAVLGLGDPELQHLLLLAGCVTARMMQTYIREEPMEQRQTMPKGWYAAGSHPSRYALGRDEAMQYQDLPSGFIKAREHPEGFATLMQTFRAEQYRAQRLQLRAQVRAQEVGNWAGLWMRVDGPQGKLLAFDNMQGRPITGTAEWTAYAVVLDVPADAEKIAFGILLNGPGQVWIAQVGLEAVGADVATTDRQLPDEPVNLSFTDG